MADSESGYKVGPGRPPLHTRFQFGGCSALSPVAGLDPAIHRPRQASCQLPIGVGKVWASPPSEPCERFSRTRLSGCWFPHRGCLA